MRGPRTDAGGARKAPRHEIEEGAAPRSGRRYGDLAAVQGVRRLERSGGGAVFASKHGCGCRGKRAERRLRGQIGAARAGQSSDSTRASALAVESRQYWRVSLRSWIGDDSIMKCRS